MIRIQSRSPLVSLAVRRSKGFRRLCSLWFKYDLCLNRKPPSDHILALHRSRGYWQLCSMSRKPPSDHNKISRKAWYLCLNRTSWQQVLFNLSENSNLREINFFWTGSLNRIWKLQNIERDKFTLSRIWELKNLAVNKFPLNRFLNQILRVSVLCGREMSLEPDFKPESFFLSRKFSDGL